MRKYTLEICTDSVESAINAEKGGGTRLELCSNLIIGGTTPAASLFEEVRKNVSIPINVLIRPRFGDFLYSEYELEIMRNEIKMFRNLGADGIVTGVLTKDGKIDIENMEKFILEAKGIPVTVHRAFDVCKNPISAFYQLKKLGVNTIFLKEKKLLKDLVGFSNENNEKKPEILVGAGLNRKNIKEIISFTGASNFHFSAKKIKQSEMLYRKENVNMGLKEFSEFEILETDENLVKEMSEYLQEIFGSLTLKKRILV